MTVAITMTETPDTLVVTSHMVGLREKVELPKFEQDHRLLIGWGKVKISQERKVGVMTMPVVLGEYEAPHIVLLSPGAVTCEAATDEIVIYSLFDKSSGALDLVRDWVSGMGGGTGPPIPTPIPLAPFDPSGIHLYEVIPTDFR